MNQPKLQLALDTFTLPAALATLQKTHEFIDVIECGTILCLSEGMHAVRAVKALFPDKPVLADVRIAEAGSIISKMCFDAGADWVSVVSGAAPASAEVVLKEAKARDRDMQIELSDGWTWQQVEHWRDLGVEQIITKRSRDAEARGELSWQERDFEVIHKLHAMGYKVSVAGSVTAEDLVKFAGVPVYIFIVGRAIAGATDPAAAAKAFQAAIRNSYGVTV
jgi:3-dehydro-L-gulonate-6-phosphate decarboxylase